MQELAGRGDHPIRSRRGRSDARAGASFLASRRGNILACWPSSGDACANIADCLLGTRSNIHCTVAKKDNCELGSTSRLFYASANRTIPQKHARTSGSLAYFSLLFLFLVPFCFFRHGGISLYRLVGLPHGRALLILGRVHVLFKSIRMVTFIEGRSAGEVHVRGSNNFAYNQFAEVEIVRFTWHNKFRYGFFWVPEYINIQTTIIQTNVGDFWPEGGTPGGLEPSF